jgi:hypothetical protein
LVVVENDIIKQEEEEKEKLATDQTNRQTYRSYRINVLYMASTWLFLGTFAKFRRATINFVITIFPSTYLSDCLSVFLHGSTRFPLDAFW